MRFGFIGTGNMGGALARAARRRLAGEDLLLANRTEAKAAALAKELGARCPTTGPSRGTRTTSSWGSSPR